MLFILRKLRRSFFQPGKLRTYIAYAVGEIILIAVQIGDWNQARADEKLKDGYIVRLIENIKDDIGTFNTQTGLNELGVSILEFLMQAAQDPEIVRDRSVEFMAAVKLRKRILEAPISSDTYEDLLFTGNMRLIEDGLKKAIFGYYQLDKRLRAARTVEEDITIQYYRLSQGILTSEQANWLADHYPRVTLTTIEYIKAETYDAESVVEAAYRLQKNTELTQMLPDMRSAFLTGIRRSDVRMREANELLEALLGELEN